MEQTTPTEEVRVRVRRYDAPDGTPGTNLKLEVSRWRILKSGDRKPKAGVRLTRTEAAALLAALLGTDMASVEIDSAWNAVIRRGKSASAPGDTGSGASARASLNPHK